MCVFFCLGGQGLAFAAETATPPSSDQSAAADELEGGAAPASPQTGTEISGVAEESAEAAIEEEVAAEVGEPVGPTFVLAPIAWGGDVSESFRKRIVEPGQPRLQNVQTVNLRAMTYFWQPWLVQVNGGIGVVNAKNVYGTSTNDDVSLNGGAALSLVPYSRYPFQASYYARDSRSDAGAIASAANRSTNFEVRQHYRPVSQSSDSEASYNRNQTVMQQIGSTASRDKVNSRLRLQHDFSLPGSPSRFGLGYDRRTFSGDVSDAGAITGLRGSYSTMFNNQFIEANTSLSDSEYAQDSSRFNNVRVSHTYRPESLWSVATSAFASQSESLSLGLNSASTRNLQLNSSASWQPDEELPFYVSGSVRVSDAVYETSTSSVISQSQIGSASVNYAATPNLRYTVSETLANTRSGGSSAGTTSTAGGADYNSDETQFRSAFHRWHANGGFEYRTSSVVVPNTVISGGAGQGLRMPYALERGAMDFNFNQALLVRKSGTLGQFNTLTHNGGVIWRPESGETLSGAVNFTVADMRAFGDRSSHLQTANLGVNALHKAAANSSMTAGVALGWTGNERGQSSTSANVDVRYNYNHARAFNVKGLRYTLTLQVSKFQLEDSYSRNAVSSRDGYLADQKLEYAIGRAYLRLNGSVAKRGKLKNTLIVLQLGRNFGDI